MKLLIILGIIVVIGLGFLFWELKKAPMGYEDKDGFHEGEEP